MNTSFFRKVFPVIAGLVILLIVFSIVRLVVIVALFVGIIGGIRWLFFVPKGKKQLSKILASLSRKFS